MAALEGAVDAGAGWVLVAGAPGIGKTTLLRELCALADARRRLVLTGRGTELEREVPFGVLIDALDDYLGALGPAGSAQLGAERVAQLAAVFPALTGQEQSRRRAGPSERYRTGRALRGVLERLADRRGLVLVLDDLHWADTASVELVCHLLYRPPDARVLLAMALRPAQAPARLQAALAAADRQQRDQSGLGLRLPLGPLSEGEAAELLAVEGVTDQDLRVVLYQESGGNPFYLEQLARAVPVAAGRRGRARGRAAQALADVPDAVTAAIGEEIGRLAPDVRRVAHAAAVVGEPFAPELVSAVAESPEPAVLAALDRMVAAGLVAVTEVPRWFRFRHPIVRRAVYESAGAGWRLAAHARAAAVLARSDGPIAARAHHTERCAVPGDQDAVSLLVAAADQTLLQAPATAAHWLTAARRLLPEGARPPRRLEVLVPLADALRACGRLKTAHEVFQEALRLPADQAGLRLRLLVDCADVELLLGRHERTRARLTAALELEQGNQAPSTETAALQVALAAVSLWTGDYAAGRAQAGRGLNAARSLGHHGLGAVAASLLAYCLQCDGEPAGTVAALCADAARSIDALTDNELARWLEAPLYLGYAELFAERYLNAVAQLGRGLAVAHASGHQRLVNLMLSAQAAALLFQGRLAEAGEVAETAVGAARLEGTSLPLVGALGTAARVFTCAGDLRRAVTAGEEAAALSHSLEPDASLRCLEGDLAMMYLEAGRLEECRAMLTAAGAPDLEVIEPGSRCRFYETATALELAAGRPEAASAWADRAERTARRSGLTVASVVARRARALVLLAGGDPTRAAALALDAAADADEAGAPMYAARCRLLAGDALARAGQEDQARSCLAQAEAELAAMGARRWRDQAAGALRQLGGQAPRRARHGQQGSGLAALSGRETQIAELVAAGQTNREIAAALFVSDKTVERHLTRVFAKLHVTSRAAVAAAVSQASHHR